MSGRLEKIKGSPAYLRKLERQRGYNRDYRQYQAAQYEAQQQLHRREPTPILQVVHPSVYLPLKGSIALSLAVGFRRKVA